MLIQIGMFTGMFEHITSYKVVTQVIFFQVKKICGKVSSEQNLSETFVVGIIFHFIFIPNTLNCLFEPPCLGYGYEEEGLINT